MELIVSIGVNLVLGLLLLALLRWKHGVDAVRLAGADDAVHTFRRFFPEASGIATVGGDGRSALIELPGDSGIGLLQRHGRRWNARMLLPNELARVRQDADGAISLAFADFGWPRTRIPIADADTRAKWLARLEALAPDVRHA